MQGDVRGRSFDLTPREQIEHLAASATRGGPYRSSRTAPRTYHHLHGSVVIATLDQKEVVFVEVPGLASS